jgi:hypothetical protein
MSAPSAATDLPDTSVRGTRTRWTYNRPAFLRIRRHIRQAAALDEEQRSHILLWLDDLDAGMIDDPRQQAMASVAASLYLECVKAQASLMATPPETKESAHLTAQLIRCSINLGKLLRLAGFKATQGPKVNGHTPGNVFTAPRVNAGNGQPREEAAEENGVPASDE